jgi:transcriptional regulator with XRE-family HTH domain
MSRKPNRKKKAIDRSIEKTIGQRVRVLRMQLGMSQEALAKEVGLTFQQIQKYEKGTNRISVSRMLEFCEHLQTTPNEIIGWGAVAPAVNGINGVLFAIARDFSQMPEDIQIALRRISQALMEVISKKR